MILALATLPSIVGCEAPAPKETVTPEARVSRVIDRREGVYQFPVSEWPQSLVDFKKMNPDKRVTAMFGGETFGGGTGMSVQTIIVVTEPAE